MQWLPDPGRDGALNLVRDQPGQIDRRLWIICERLIALMPVGRSGTAAGSPTGVDVPAVAAVLTGPERGKLSGVPALPPGYLERDELDAVMKAVVAAYCGAVGLHGQGSIGKSVLAAAVARDEDIRSSCSGWQCFRRHKDPGRGDRPLLVQTHDHTAEQTEHDLDALAATNVLSRDADTVGFHDLQHDYLLLHARCRR